MSGVLALSMEMRSLPKGNVSSPHPRTKTVARHQPARPLLNGVRMVVASEVGVVEEAQEAVVIVVVAAAAAAAVALRKSHGR